MKKILWLMCILPMLFTACKKDNGNNDIPVPAPASLTADSVNRAALLDFSETWCPPCGQYGGPAFDSLLSYEGNKITCMKIYSSSVPASLNSSISNGWLNDYNVPGFPDFYVNNSPLIATAGVYSTISSNVNGVMTKVNLFDGSPVVAGIGLKSSIGDDSISVETIVKFFQAQSAGKNYKLGVYVVEDDIIAAQQVSGSGGTTTVANYVHHNLLRRGNAPTYTGVALNNSTAITAGQTFKATYKIALAPNWIKTKLKVIGILWNATSTPAIITNSNME